MKLPHTFAAAMSLTILAAMTALPTPARAQTYDPSYPVCLQIYQSIADFYFECRYRTMGQCMAVAPVSDARNIGSAYQGACEQVHTTRVCARAR